MWTDTTALLLPKTISQSAIMNQSYLAGALWTKILKTVWIINQYKCNQ